MLGRRVSTPDEMEDIEEEEKEELELSQGEDIEIDRNRPVGLVTRG